MLDGVLVVFKSQYTNTGDCANSFFNGFAGLFLQLGIKAGGGGKSRLEGFLIYQKFHLFWFSEECC